MPLLILRTRTKPQRPLTALEEVLLSEVRDRGLTLMATDFPVAWIHADRSDARRALSALWRRGLLTRVGWGDTAVYRRKP